MKSTKLGSFVGVGVLQLGLVLTNQAFLLLPQTPKTVLIANNSVIILPSDGAICHLSISYC